MYILSAIGGTSLSDALSGPQGLMGFLRRMTTEQARGFRVLMLLCAVVTLSIVDLIMTLTYATTTGMVELNPVARMLMQTHNPIYIILYKGGSVLLASVILFKARKTRVGELGTILAVCGLMWLTIRWAQYSDAMEIISGHMQHLANIEQSNWVEMRPD